MAAGVRCWRRTKSKDTAPFISSKPPRLRVSACNGPPFALAPHRRVLPMLKRTSFLAVVLAGVLAAGCGSGGLGATGSSVSLDQEWQLGNQMAAQVAQQMQLSNDATAKAYLTQVGERIHAATPLADRPFTFDIVNDPSVNAFSIPGGHIYINSGLIAQADKADMLAGVVAHEISQYAASHVIKQSETQQ